MPFVLDFPADIHLGDICMSLAWVGLTQIRLVIESDFNRHCLSVKQSPCTKVRWHLRSSYNVLFERGSGLLTPFSVTQIGHFGYHYLEAAKMPYNYREYSLVSFVNTLFYFPVLGLVKASMILLYLRLGGTKKGVRIGCYVLLFIIIAQTISTSVADLLQCLPITYNWDRIAMDKAAQVRLIASTDEI